MTTREDLRKLTDQRRREFPEPPTPSRAPWGDAVEQARARAAERPARPEGPTVSIAAIEAEQHRQREATWRQLIPARFRGAHVDQLDGDLAAAAADWDGRQNILLLGSVGVGKTHAAVAIARGAHDTGRTVQFRPAVELLDDLRPGGPERTMESACDVDVLILDDLGSERPTDWTFERLYRLVNRRWLEQRPTIVTANVAGDELATTVGDRMWSRFMHGAIAFEVAGTDRRRAGAA